MIETDFQIKQAVILAGGRGERLRPLTDEMPKPMAPVRGVPFLDYLLHSLVQVGIRKFLLLLGYKAEMIASRYSNLEGLHIEFSFGVAEDQTGRRVLNAYDQLDDVFLLMYGDNYWPIELEAMKSTYAKTNASVSTTVFGNKDGTGEYGFGNNVVVNNNVVIKYDKKRETQSANGVDIGYFLVKKHALSLDMLGNVSFEEDILPEFIAKQALVAYVTDTQYYFITSIKTLQDFEIAVEQNNFSPLTKAYFKA